jgi:hypothetical protein
MGTPSEGQHVTTKLGRGREKASLTQFVMAPVRSNEMPREMIRRMSSEWGRPLRLVTNQKQAVGAKKARGGTTQAGTVWLYVCTDIHMDTSAFVRRAV